MQKITRRGFVVGSGQALTTLSLMSPGFAWAQTEAAPIKGGTLTFSQAGVPPGYDPHKWWNAQAGSVQWMVTEPLIRNDAYTGERLPVLATGEPDVSDDGRVFTFSLRPNVRFHGDNGTLTADDVKFSFERLMSPTFGAETGFIFTGVPIVGLQAFLDGSANDISGIRVVDELTLEISLERGDSAFLPAFSYTSASIVPRSYYEGKSLEEVNWTPVGTGPFMMGPVEPATGAQLVRHPDYWDPDRPHVDAVDITFNVDPQLALLRVQSGELDLMLEPVPAASLNQIRNDPAMAGFLYESLQNDCQFLSMPTQLPPFDDVRVRQAVAMAIDKEKLVKVLRGQGVPANGTFFSPSSRYFEDDVAYAYDPEGARALLAEAGYPDGVDVPFWYQAQPPYSDMGPAIIEDLAQIGMRCQAEAMIYDQFVQEVSPGPPAVIIFAWEDAYLHGSYFGDPGFRSSVIDEGCCNYARLDVPELDELAELGHSTDIAVSDQAYRDMARLAVRDLAAWVPLLYPTRSDLANSEVRNYRIAIYPTGQVKRLDEYWLDRS